MKNLSVTMIENLKLLIKKAMPPTITKALINIYVKYLDLKYVEKNETWGEENEDKTFYVIRRTPKGSGLLSNYHFVISKIIEAEERGMIPVVDMEKTLTNYNEKTKINNTWNAWEYYWEQPAGYKLEDIKHSKSIVLSAGKPTEFFDKLEESIDDCNDEFLSKVMDVVKKISFTKETIEYVDKMRPCEFRENKRILGIAVRGTDYNEKTAPMHRRQYSCEETLKITKKLMKEWDMEYIFVTTEEQETLEKFKNEFGDKLLYLNRERFSNYDGKNLVPTIRFNRENDRYLTGLEYLTEIIILSECTSLFAGYNGGSATAILMNNNRYEHRFIANLGYMYESSKDEIFKVEGIDV